jgi:ketosteroid isomerase-like protein
VIYGAFDPAVEFHEDPSFPEAGVYTGIEDVRAYFDRFSDSFDEITFRVEDVIGLGEGRALGLYELTTRGEGSGATVTSHPGWLFEFRDGRAIRIDAWLDRETALRNAGVEP